jgi:rhomboid protease GluP
VVKIFLLIDFQFLNKSKSVFSFISPSSESLLILGACGTIPVNKYNLWWSFVSANYLHGSLLHIFFNMAALKNLAPFVFRVYGVDNGIIIYTLSGIFGFFVSYLAGVKFTIGASGAICGFIGVLFYYGKVRKDRVGNIIYKQSVGWIISLAIFGIIIPGINNWGHGGGVIAGICFGLFLGKDIKYFEILIWILGKICIIITILVLIWVVFLALTQI